MVGTGPFKFKEWVPGDHVTLVKNADYWDAANKAHLDTLTLKPMGDSTAKLQALQSGDIDLAQTISPTDVAYGQELRPDDHRPRPVLQHGLPGPEPEHRRHSDHLRQQGRPLRRRRMP